MPSSRWRLQQCHPAVPPPWGASLVLSHRSIAWLCYSYGKSTRQQQKMLYIVEYFSIFNLQKSGAKLRKYIHTYTILTLIIVIMPPVATQSDSPQRCLNTNRSLDFGLVVHLCLSDCFLPCRGHSWLRRGVAESKTADRSVQNDQRALNFPHFAV